MREECEGTGGATSGLMECCDGSCLKANPGECRDAADCGGYACERLDPQDCFGRCTGGFGGNGGNGGMGGAGVGGATAGTGGTSGGSGGASGGAAGAGGAAAGAGGTAGASGGTGGASGAAGMSSGGTAGQSTGGAAGAAGTNAGGAAGAATGGTSGAAGSAGTAGTASGGASTGGSAGSGGSMGGEGDPCTQTSDCHNVCATGSGSPPQTHVYSQICQGNKCQRYGRLETCGLKCDGQQLKQTVCSAGACQLDALVEDCSTKVYGAGEAGCYLCEDRSPSRCELQYSNGVWGDWVPSSDSVKHGSCSTGDPNLVWYWHFCDNPAPTCGGIWCYWTTGAPGGPSSATQPEFRCGPP